MFYLLRRKLQNERLTGRNTFARGFAKKKMLRGYKTYRRKIVSCKSKWERQSLKIIRRMNPYRNINKCITTRAEIFIQTTQQNNTSQHTTRNDYSNSNSNSLLQSIFQFQSTTSPRTHLPQNTYVHSTLHLRPLRISLFYNLFQSILTNYGITHDSQNTVGSTH